MKVHFSGTDGAKMSKSYNNTIDMFTTSKQRKKQVMSIVTDSKELDGLKSGKIAISIIFQNYL